jgi:hypothetical protein
MVFGDISLTYQQSNEIIKSSVWHSFHIQKQFHRLELLSRVVYGGSGGVLFHPNAILENGAVHDLR